MVKLKLDNPKLEFHPTYYNQCPNCGCKEVSKVQEQQQKQKYLKSFVFKLFKIKVELYE